MSQSKNNEPIEIQQTKIQVPEDKRFWFGAQADLQNINNRWWRWLWWLWEHPKRPRNWDAYYYIPTWEFIVYWTYKPNRWTITTANVFDYSPDILYIKWDTVFFSGLMYEATEDQPTTTPNTLIWWKLTNIISKTLSPKQPYLRATRTTAITVNSGTNTALLSWTKNITSNNLKMATGTSLPWFWLSGIYIPEDWDYEIQWSVLWWEIWWQYEKTIWIFYTDPITLLSRQLTYHTQKLPPITATSTTTWTDSVWWPISATTITTINIGTTTNTTMNIFYRGRFKEWEYVNLFAFHNSPTPVQILPPSVLDKRNSDGTYLYIVRTS